jgi:hypothetical protein
VAISARADLLNGTFEPAVPFTGTRLVAPGNAAIPGWSVVGGSVLWVAGSAGDPAPEGALFFVRLSDGTLRQSFPTIPGAWYRLDAVTESPAGTGASFLVDGNLVGILRAEFGSHPIWTKRAFRFVATSSWTTLDVTIAPGSTGIARIGHLSITATQRVTPALTTTWGWLKDAYR